MRKATSTEVKRCFVTANFARPPRQRRRYVGGLPKEEFTERVVLARKRAAALSPRQLDNIIAKEYKRRLRAYDNSDWVLRTVRLNEVGVWRKAGELPHAWTTGSAVDTARHVRSHQPPDSALRQFAKIAAWTQREKLYPIVFQHNTGTTGRRSLSRKLLGHLDDGCMRSIALALSGRKTVTVYFGTPKKK